jgi:hypothetical protein
VEAAEVAAVMRIEGGNEMNEQQWQAAEDPIDMLLRPPPGIAATDRKIRLFSCVCCRRVWDKMSDENRSTVELAERYADSLASEGELANREEDCRLYHRDVYDPDILQEDRPPEYWCDVATWYSVTRRAADGFYEVCDATRRVARDRSGEWEDVVQARLLRDLFGPLPFRPVTLDAAWLVWCGGLLVSMAARMYESRDFSDMPVLADGLEEAGCTDPEILSHCRSGGVHVKGCWVVDLVLGKT